MQKVLALNSQGQLTYCSVPPEKRGIGRCNHIGHQEQGESEADFIQRMNDKIEIEDGSNSFSNKDKEVESHITHDQLIELANKIDEIAGTHVTSENLMEVLKNMDPEKARLIHKIGFETAQEFNIPILNDEKYGEADFENKIYFSDLPRYGIAGKNNSLKQMYDSVGEVPTADGTVDIKGNYEKGLSPSEYFEKLYSGRAASINKTVSVAEPGYIARKLFYGMSDIQVKENCGNKNSEGILECSIPGGVCEHCLRKSGINRYKAGDMIGGEISTHISEPLTQVAMKKIHSGGADLTAEKKAESKIFENTYNGFANSYIVQGIKDAKTTEEARKFVYESLKKEYAREGVAMDDYNIAIVAKKLTSYKNDKNGCRLIQPGEKCDVVSMGRIGNSQNPFKSAQLGSPYKTLTKPIKITIPPDSAWELGSLDVE